MVLETLSSEEAFSVLKPLFIYMIGIVIYAVFVFKFYKFLARKDIFDLDLQQYNTATHPGIRKFFRVTLYLFQYIFIMPLFTFFWFGVLTILLAFLAKEQPMPSILLISIAVVGAIRFTAYYNEDLSNDLAKMLPFALLGIFLVNASYFSFQDAFVLLREIPSHFNLIVYYLVFIVLIEFLLRILFFILSPLFSRKERQE